MDMFPAEPVDSLPEFNPPRNLKQWQLLPNVVAFLPRTVDKLFHYDVLAKGVPNGWSDYYLLLDNFKRTAQESSNIEFFDPNKINFVRLDARYSRKAKNMKKTDCRVGFRIEPHQFLVKAYFSFGQRKVQKGTCHVFKTFDAPMIFYRYERSTEITRNFFFHDRFLGPDDVLVYERYVLQPHTKYVVTEETIYAVLTVQKSFFSVAVLNSVPSWGFRDPTADKKLVDELPVQNRRERPLQLPTRPEVPAKVNLGLSPPLNFQPLPEPFTMFVSADGTCSNYVPTPSQVFVSADGTCSNYVLPDVLAREPVIHFVASQNLQPAENWTQEMIDLSNRILILTTQLEELIKNLKVFHLFIHIIHL